MAVDASAVARVTGISTQFQDTRDGAALFLPQQVAILAQGATSVTYSTDRYQITSAVQAGRRYGFGSPIHLIAEQLFPANGDGIGTVPVHVYPLTDADGSAAAEGDITPSGAQLTSGQYRLRAAGVQSPPFVIAKDATLTAKLIAIHDAALGNLSFPLIPSYEYDTVTSQAGGGNGGDGTVGTLSVTGSPTPGSYVLECVGEVANGGVFSLTAPDGTVIADDLTLEVGSGGSTVFNVGGIQFTVTDGTDDFEEGDLFTITVPATKVNFTTKWQGISANDVLLEVLGEDLGTTFAITQPTGGLVNPDVQDALDKIGERWITMVINGLNPGDTDALDAIQTFGGTENADGTLTGRWDALVKKPLVAFVGTTETDVATATAVTGTRTDDLINVQIPAPGSPNLPCVVAARGVARIARLANNNPPHDYGSQRLTGIIPGDDAEQWDYLQRDQAVKAGSSTTQVKGGVVSLSDVVTFYAPEGEPNPAYRFVVDIVKMMNVLYNVALEFESTEWDGAPLIPDDEPTVNPTAKKPKMAKGAAAAIVDGLADQAIVVNREQAKANISADINSQNSKRLDITIPVQVSGNTNIKAIDLRWGFFFGSPTAA